MIYSMQLLITHFTTNLKLFDKLYLHLFRLTFILHVIHNESKYIRFATGLDDWIPILYECHAYATCDTLIAIERKRFFLIRDSKI